MEKATGKRGTQGEIIAQSILQILQRISKREDLLKLFREVLGFNPPRISSYPTDLGENINSAEIIAEFGQTKVFYINFVVNFDGSFASERKIRNLERQTILKLDVAYRRDNVFVFSDADGCYWDFVYPASYGRRLLLKRFSIRPDNRGKLRTPSIQLAKLKVQTGDESKISRKLEECFSVEAVSEQFYKHYQMVFNTVKKELLKQFSDEEKVHRFVHQLFNRLMFLYFVQRRGVFNKDKNFLATFWNAYRDNYEGRDEFYDKWLKVLFFKVLNRKFSPKKEFKISKDLDFNSIFSQVPYLNGGLFRKDPQIDDLNIKIPDKLFVRIFEFLESYNFTARESTPLDEDLEIDPEMLGNVYETMVNVSEKAEDERHKLGIYYTQRTEIDFMLRRSLVEFLYNKTKIDKFLLYQFVFPEMEEEKIPQFNREDAIRLYDILDKIIIVDPACGSGHYLVVAVQILYDLKKTLWIQMGNSEESFKPFDEKKKIIENSIFGVDVKKWATEIAKLRLWLDLLVSVEDEHLMSGGEALLPNLSFKIRVGDSLVQQIGGTFFKVKEFAKIPSSLYALKNQLIDAKRGYFREENFDEDIVKSREIEFFKALIDEKIKELELEIKKLESSFQKNNSEQLTLIPVSESKTKNINVETSKKNKEKIKKLKDEINRLNEEKNNIKRKSEYAFWSIEFSDILLGQEGEGGFDIVIANPPYVRHELICDPRNPKDKKLAKIYKENLLKQIRLDWNDDKGNLIRLDESSDLYVYFYLKGLQLLNPDGVMCYISSNSWLYVKFGAKLQEILLRRVPIIAIYDNEMMRSFKQANINTIIALLGAPKKSDWDGNLKENKVKFVMFKKPFEEVCYSEILWQIDDAKEEIIQNENFRLVQKRQYDLYIEGVEESGTIGGEIGKYQGHYIGNKWGGKYLRAPKIYFKILEKGKDKLVRLTKLGKIEGYIHGFNVGNKYPKTFFISSISEVKQIYLDKNTPGVYLFGVKKSGNSRDVADILYPRMFGDRYLVLINFGNVLGQKFYKIILKEKKDKIRIGLFLNSTLSMLQNEVLLYTAWGSGAISINSDHLYEIYVLPQLNFNEEDYKNFIKRPIHSIFTELGFDPQKPIREQEPNPLPDRKALDDIVFDALGLTEEERKEVYWAVAELVQKRLKKSKSVKSR